MLYARQMTPKLYKKGTIDAFIARWRDTRGSELASRNWLYQLLGVGFCGRTRLAGPLAICATIAISGCDSLLGQASREEERAKSMAANLLLDPVSAQFRNIRTVRNGVCGEINGKNRLGAYTGFDRFFALQQGALVQLNPGFDPANLISARDFCTATYAPASACNRFSEELVKQTDQIAFDHKWKIECAENGVVEATTAPFDPTVGKSFAPDEKWKEQPPTAPRHTLSPTRNDEVTFDDIGDE